MALGKKEAAHVYRRENDGRPSPRTRSLTITAVRRYCLMDSRWHGTRYGGISVSAIPMNRDPHPRYLLLQPVWRKGNKDHRQF